MVETDKRMTVQPVQHAKTKSICRASDKSRIEHLASSRSESAMSIAATSFLPFHRASIEKDEISAVVDVLQCGWLTTGPRVREFEEKFGRYVGARHSLAVSSCTAALHLALAA